MNVVVTNTVVLNGGDAAILIAAERMLKRAFGANLRLTVVDGQAAVARRYYPEFHFEQHLYEGIGKSRLRRLYARAIPKLARALARNEHPAWQWLVPLAARRALDAYAQADLVVSTGGTYLVEHYDITGRLFEFRVVEEGRAPLVFLTQSLGPFERRRNRVALKRQFARSPLVLLRDERSKRHVLDLGVRDANLHVHGDVVFSLLTEDALERLRTRRLPDTDVRVAVSVRSWHRFKRSKASIGQQRYVETMAAVVRDWIERRGAHCEFVSTCQGIPEYWTHDDHMAEQIVAALPVHLRRHTTVNHEFHHPLALRDYLARFDVVFATRMHAAILALTAGTPVLPVAYEFKTRELFEALNFADVCLDIDDLAPTSAVAIADRFLRTIDARRVDLAERIRLQADSASGVVERLQQLRRTHDFD